MIMEGILFLSFQVSVQIRSTHISSFCYVSVLIFGKKPEKHISSNCNNIKRKKKQVTPVFFKSILHTLHLLSGRSKCKDLEE